MTSTSTSTSRSPRSNSARGASNTTTSAAATRWTRRRGPAARRPECGHDRNRRGHLLAREAGHERVCARGRRCFSTPTRVMRADWTAFGACTSGSTASRRDVTSRVSASGGAATTITTNAKPSRGSLAKLRDGRFHDAWLPSKLRSNRSTASQRYSSPPARRRLSRIPFPTCLDDRRFLSSSLLRTIARHFCRRKEQEERSLINLGGIVLATPISRDTREQWLLAQS
jgi:hypothetical protein